MSEAWRPVSGYEGRYEVSDQGRVRSWLPTKQRLPLPNLLVQIESEKGYLRVQLSGPDGRRNRRVHALVLEAFVGPCPEGMQTRHMDGDKANNTLGNLSWGTPSENILDCVRLGTHFHAAQTHCKRDHAFTPENTYVRPRGWRECRKCRAESPAPLSRSSPELVPAQG